eukprot:15548325-Heterocapsa_arctica.AAC.1
MAQLLAEVAKAHSYAEERSSAQMERLLHTAELRQDALQSETSSAVAEALAEARSQIKDALLRVHDEAAASAEGRDGSFADAAAPMRGKEQPSCDALLQ